MSLKSKMREGLLEDLLETLLEMPDENKEEMPLELGEKDPAEELLMDEEMSEDEVIGKPKSAKIELIKAELKPKKKMLEFDEEE